jgi:Rrf2 family protein
MLGIIAKNQDLSEKYLEQLFTLLRNAGLVKSERGSKGGYRLAKKAEEISAFDIFIALNGPLELVECSVNKECCERFSNCDTAGLWKEISDSLKKTLMSKNLKELSKSNSDNNSMFYI